MRDIQVENEEAYRKNQELNNHIDELFFNVAFDDINEYEKLKDKIHSDEISTPAEITTLYAALNVEAAAFPKLKTDLKRYKQAFDYEINDYIFNEEVGALKRIAVAECNNVDRYLTAFLIQPDNFADKLGTWASDRSPLAASLYGEARYGLLDEAVKAYASKEHGSEDFEITLNTKAERSAASAMLIGDAINNEDFLKLLRLEFQPEEPDPIQIRLRDATIEGFMDLVDAKKEADLPGVTKDIYKKLEAFKNDKKKYLKEKENIQSSVKDEIGKAIQLDKINPLQNGADWSQITEADLDKGKLIDRFQDERIRSNNFYKRHLPKDYSQEKQDDYLYDRYEYLRFLNDELDSNDPNEEKLCVFWALALNIYGTESEEASDLAGLRRAVSDKVEPYLTLKKGKLLRLQKGLAPIAQLQICADAMRPDRKDFWLISERGEPISKDQDAFATGFRATFKNRFGKHRLEFRLKAELDLFKALEKENVGTEDLRDSIYWNRVTNLVSTSDAAPSARYESERELFDMLIKSDLVAQPALRRFGGRILNLAKRQRGS